jgi:hypothetical protein
MRWQTRRNIRRSMTKLTGVGFVLSVGHNSPEGVPHGHSYDVTVLVSLWTRRPRPSATDGRGEAAALPHADLRRAQLAENLAEHIAGELPGCVAVDCNRPLERIYARWEAILKLRSSDATIKFVRVRRIAIRLRPTPAVGQDKRSPRRDQARDESASTKAAGTPALKLSQV